MGHSVKSDTGSWIWTVASVPATDMPNLKAQPNCWQLDATTGLVWRPVAKNLALTGVVQQVTPVSGPQAGGTGVYIGGFGFQTVTGVTFGGTAATGVTVNTNQDGILCTSPAHAAGAAPVVVVRSSGGNITGPNFTYV
jgi:hypothetical protein